MTRVPGARWRGGEREARAQMQRNTISQDAPPLAPARTRFPPHATRFNDGEPVLTR